MTHDPLRAALEIREQLASEKRKLAFLFGAGASMAVGIPGINELTEQVSKKLIEPQKKTYENIKSKLQKSANIEQILSRIRTIKELLSDNEKAEYDGIQGKKAAMDLDIAICQSICEIINGATPKEKKCHLIFAHWMRSLHGSRYSPVEIFTTNYDLLMEQAMEDAGLPFFDGFIGSVAPFFAPESVEAEEGKTNIFVYPPRAWTRLWKLHGSVNWIMQSKINDKFRIARLSGVQPRSGEELMIFPTREKYTESRKLPFLTFQDRFRKFLSSGEALLIILGYSFLDEHINEIILQGLRSNPRLAIIALIHGETKDSSKKDILTLPERISSYAEEYRNLTIYGPDKGCIGGVLAPWQEPYRKRKDTETWPFWNEEKKSFTLGDFKYFASYLEVFIGFRTLGGPKIESIAEELTPQEDKKL